MQYIEEAKKTEEEKSLSQAFSANSVDPNKIQLFDGEDLSKIEIQNRKASVAKNQELESLRKDMSDGL